MANNLREKLVISPARLDEINRLLLDPDNRRSVVHCVAIQAILDVVARYGSVEEINRQAEEARRLPNLLARLEACGSPYREDLAWLTEQRERGAFISIPAYRRRVLGERADRLHAVYFTALDPHFAVTLEISACQYFGSELHCSSSPRPGRPSRRGS